MAAAVGETDSHAHAKSVANAEGVADRHGQARHEGDAAAFASAETGAGRAACRGSKAA